MIRLKIMVQMQQEKKESCSFFFFIPTPKTIFFIFIFGNFKKDFALEKKKQLKQILLLFKKKVGSGMGWLAHI